MLVHGISFLAGFLLDLAFGDPYWLPHPVRWIGAGIARLEKCLRKEDDSAEKQKRKGTLLVLAVLCVTVCAGGIALYIAYTIHTIAGCIVESILTYQLLAAKCLKKESMKVYDRLAEKDLEGARKAVSMIVGRDTQKLDCEGVAKAAIETVAENTSDGVIAPMLFLAFGGPVCGLFYKAVNTMDSMIGYKNETYLFFGRTAARLDDVLNYIPARISALLMILASFFSGKEYSGRNAWRIFCRDRYKHASPNSAQTEAVCAGALGIRLAGNASYFGKIVEKPYIGDALRTAEPEDIKRANHLMMMTAWICEILCLMGIYVISCFFYK